MNIDVSYDPSANSAPAGFRTAVNAAVSYLDSVITSPISVNIDVGWGEVDGQKLESTSVGESLANGDGYTYAQVRSALAGAATSTDDHASVAALPSTDPTHGGQFFLPNAEEKALGLTPSPGSPDGWVALSSTAPFTFDPGARAVPGEYDAVGVLEHEITEVLGRTSGVGQTLSDGSSYYTALDLFRYAGPGQLSPSAQSAYFSVDGQHMLYAFNNPAGGGDPGDWADGIQGDSFTEAASTGAVLSVSSTDLRVMDVLGYTVAGQSAVLKVSSDFNGDGLSDLLWSNPSAVQVSDWQSTGPSFEGVGAWGAPSGWVPVGVGDFNGDGEADVLWFDAQTVQVSDWQANGSGFQGVGVQGAPSGWVPVGVGDFTGDGKADIAWFDPSTDQATVWRSTGSGFVGMGVMGAPAGWAPTGAGDFNGDGKADILWFDQSTNQVSVWQSTGSGFQGVGVWNAPSGWTPVGAGDFDGNGKADILWFDAQTNQISVWLSQGGTFVGAGVAGAPSGWAPVAVGDFNGDGKADIAWFNAATHQESTWLSNGAGWQSTSASLAGANLQSAPAGWTPVDAFQTGPYGLHMA